jgi:trehalose 6-phosphate phosphatase
MRLGTEQERNWLHPDTKAAVDLFLREVARAPQSVLMLDYDGTLAPFRRYRKDAFPYPGVAQLLQKIVAAHRTRVVIVSGRDAREVIPLLGIAPQPELWGLHGSQRLKNDGSIEVSPMDAGTTDALAEADDWLRGQDMQDVAEFKTGSIAVHWRGMTETEARTVQEKVLPGWTAIAMQSGLNLLPFDGGVEIRPHSPNKGDAVRTVLSEVNPDTPVAYLGDDTTDEDAFRALNHHAVSAESSNAAAKNRYLTVLVRPRRRQSKAQLWLQPPDEVLALLEQWLQALQAQEASNNEISDQELSGNDDSSLGVNV